MSFWRRSRYYCTNTSGACRYALADVPFSQDEYRQHEGRCRGRHQDGCGAELSAGDPKDLRPHWMIGSVALIAFLAVLGWATRAIFFPPPLQQIAFTAGQTSTDDKAGLLRLSVVRAGDLRTRAQVKYRSLDGTARAGEDYDALNGTLTFEPGERSKSIEVSLRADHTFSKGARYFSLTLVNVLGEPKHIVHIAPREADRTEALQAEQTVMAASRIAADIAGYMVKRRVLAGLVVAPGATRETVAEYNRQLIELHDNLSRAREGYAELLRTLQTHETSLIVRTMDRLKADLEQRKFAQQSRALAIMKTQYLEYADKQRMDMDRWATELEAAVPRLDATGEDVSL